MIPSLRERLLIALLASAPGNSVLAQAFGAAPMRITVPSLALPSLCLLLALTVGAPPAAMSGTAALVRRGALAGVLATLAYDVIRPPMRWAFGFEYDPFRAVTLFGELITGQTGTALAHLAGWTFHAIDGISFGIIFASIFPRGGVLPGLAAAGVLQMLLMLSYPFLVGVPLGNAGFLTMGVVGHAVFGVVLGAVVRQGHGRQVMGHEIL